MTRVIFGRDRPPPPPLSPLFQTPSQILFHQLQFSHSFTERRAYRLFQGLPPCSFSFCLRSRLPMPYAFFLLGGGGWALRGSLSSSNLLYPRLCVCMYVCVCACVRACVHACVEGGDVMVWSLTECVSFLDKCQPRQLEPLRRQRWHHLAAAGSGFVGRLIS